MRNLIDEGLVIQDHLVFEEVTEGRRLIQVHIVGQIECSHDLIIAVDKWLDVTRRRRQYVVQGSSYSYHAWLRHSRHILRYDSAHGLERLHRHQFDFETGDEQVSQIQIDELPSLDEFIREALSLVPGAEDGETGCPL